MSSFKEVNHFVSSENRIELLPFRFERTRQGEYLVSNMVGDFLRLSEHELNNVVNLDLSPGDGLYEKAFRSHLITRENDRAQKQLLGLRLRSRMSFLTEPTALHIFVVTLRCEHSCPYCQVSRQSTDKSRFDMSDETAADALRIAFESPNKRIKIEFQGGEPLLNTALIKKIVIAGRDKATESGKLVDFVIATNLVLLDDDIIEFCKTHDVFLSTSLDGPADLHNKNRPRPGNNSHELAGAGIRRAQSELGNDRISALMTTTEASLDRVRHIIDEYLSFNLQGIFLRPLSPYGFAIKTRSIRKYDAPRWLEFYKQGLRYILDINRTGRFFPEFYAALLLQRVLTDKPTGYVDLRSPAGIGLGALVYNYDGAVFASDEGRMLAEMGDRTFELGRVTQDYASLVGSEKLISLVASSLTQCAPLCSDCVFENHCGADPVYHHATQGDALGIKTLSDFCARQKAVMSFLLEIMDGDPQDKAILKSWVAP